MSQSTSRDAKSRFAPVRLDPPGQWRNVVTLSIKRLCGRANVFGLVLFLSLECGFSQDNAASNTAADTDTAKSAVTVGVRFDLESLSKPPAVFPADDISVEGVKSLYYEGARYQGNGSQSPRRSTRKLTESPRRSRLVRRSFISTSSTSATVP